MIHQGDFYWVPTLPKEMRQQPKGADYKRLRSAFTAAKEEFVEWASKDRHRQMNKAAKAVLAYLVRRLNFDTGRCDPSQQLIAEELGMGVRSVERAIRNLVEAGWIAISRRGLTTTNFYRLRVPVARIEAIKEDLAERKALRVSLRQQPEINDVDHVDEDAKAAAHPSEMAVHEPSKVADQEPPKMADKPMNRTSEIEPLNEKDSNQTEGNSLVETGVEAEYEIDRTRLGADVIDFPTRHRRDNPRKRAADDPGGFGFHRHSSVWRQ
jgi:hypothetical protein